MPWGLPIYDWREEQLRLAEEDIKRQAGLHKANDAKEIQTDSEAYRNKGESWHEQQDEFDDHLAEGQRPVASDQMAIQRDLENDTAHDSTATKYTPSTVRAGLVGTQVQQPQYISDMESKYNDATAEQKEALAAATDAEKKAMSSGMYHDSINQAIASLSGAEKMNVMPYYAQQANMARAKYENEQQLAEKDMMRMAGIAKMKADTEEKAYERQKETKEFGLKEKSFKQQIDEADRRYKLDMDKAKTAKDEAKAEETYRQSMVDIARYNAKTNRIEAENRGKAAAQEKQEARTERDIQALSKVMPSEAVAMQDYLAVLQKYENADNVPGHGKIEGAYPDWSINKETMALRQAKRGALATLLKIQSGATVGDKEQARKVIETGFGDTSTDEEFKLGVKTLRDQLRKTTIALQAGYKPDVVKEYVRRGGIGRHMFEGRTGNYRMINGIKYWEMSDGTAVPDLPANVPYNEQALKDEEKAK